MSSNREQGLQSGSLQNPSQLWLEWDSNNKGLRFYDKEAGKNQPIKTPISLIFLGQRFVVTGFHDESNSRIYSNEVEFPQREPVTVRSKSGLLVSGIYKDIKKDIEDLGGQGGQRIYALLDGKIVNITIKGDSFGTWLNFRKAFPQAKPEWIKNQLLITGHEDHKKGATKWTVPVFAFGPELTEGEKQAADEAYDTLTEYFLSKKNNGNRTNGSYEPQGNELPSALAGGKGYEAPTVIDSDDLPF